MIDPEDFTFTPTDHIYRRAGHVILSATQVQKAVGLIDYSMVPPNILEYARIRGQEVHEITAEGDRTGQMPMDWASDASMARLEAYKAFLHDRRGRIKWVEIEQPSVSTVSGMWIAGTPDRVCLIDDHRWIIDLKCSDTFQPGWAIQLAFYEFMLTRMQNLGYVRRMSLQLLASGRYKPKECDDPSDGPAAIGMLAAATWMQAKGIFNPAKAA